MATLNFPDNPSTGDEYYDTNAGFNYEWNGTVWITKDLATVNNTREIDDISSGFDGSDTTFTLQINGVNIVPSKVQQLIISVGGVMQNPGDDYTVSGSTLTFTTAPLSGLSFVGTFLGVAASLNTITAGTVSPSSLTATSNYTVGSIKVSGASTIGNFVLTGLTTITDPDVTNLNSSGVGTVSNVIITADNSGLGATVGASVGVVTYFGDATNMTGVASSIFPLVYSPGIGSTSIALASDIVTTWNYPIQAGSGTITIRTGSDSGTIVDQFVVGSSSSITISGRSLTLNPAADLNEGIEHFVVYPAGAIKSTSGQKENNQLVTSFTSYAPLRSLFTTGSGTNGTLGLNDNTNRSSPTQVSGITWTTIGTNSAPMATSWAKKSDGTLWVWGRNDEFGQLGQNDNISRSSPTQLSGTTWSDSIMMGGSRQGSGGVKTDGTLWTWGRNEYGQLGLNSIHTPTPTGISSPTQIGTDTTWKTSVGSFHSATYKMFAVKTDGTAWTWGRNESGSFGLNQAPAQLLYLSSPTQIGTDTTWNTFSATPGDTYAVKTDGTLWAWGSNLVGELGINLNTGSRSSPCQVGTNTTWDLVKAAGSYGAIGKKTDGTLWGWGSGQKGNLGLNQPDNARISSPTQIGTDTTWSKFATMTHPGGAVAVKTDGTLWGWGYNENGNLGLNADDGTGRSSPTQIGTDTDWSEVGSTRYGSQFIKSQS